MDFYNIDYSNRTAAVVYKPEQTVNELVDTEVDPPISPQPESICLHPQPKDKLWGKFNLPTDDYFIYYNNVKRKPIGDYIEKPLAQIRQGSLVYDVEMVPGRGSQLARSPGTSARILEKTKEHAILQLPSKEKKEVSLECTARLGEAPQRFFPHKKLRRSKQRRYIYHRDHMLKNKPKRLYPKYIFDEKYRREMAPTLPIYRDYYDFKRFGQRRGSS